MGHVGALNHRIRNLLLMGCLILLVNLTAWILSGVLILPEYRLLEIKWAREQMLRAQSSLDREAEFLQQAVVHGAERKRVSNFVQNPARDRFPHSVTAETLEKDHVSAVVLFDARGQVLFSRGYDLTANTLEEVPAALMDQMRRLQPLLADSRFRAGLAGYLSYGTQPVLAAAAPVLEDAPKTPAIGMLVYASLLQGHVVQHLGDLTRLDLRLSAVVRPKAGDPKESVQWEEQTLHIARLIPGLFGQDALRLEVSIPPTIFIHARGSVHYFLGWVLCSSLVFAGLIFWALDRAARLEIKKTERDRLVHELLGHSSKAILLVNLNDQRILEANTEAGRLFGLTEWTSVSEALRDPEGRSCWPELLASLEANEESHPQLQLQGRDGTSLHVEVSANRLEGDGSSTYLLLQFWDVSAHKAAEASLQIALERYRLLFNGSPIPMWVYDATSLQFIDVNDAAIDHYGYSREEFQQRTILDLRPDEDAERVRDGVARLIREADSRMSRSRSVGVWPHQCKDGRALLADVSVVAFELHGRPAILASAVDVTDKVAGEQALKLSEERYRQMFHHSPLPMWVVDMSTLRYLDVNRTAEEKYGYSREEFLAMTIHDIHPSGLEAQERQRPPMVNGTQGEQRVWQYRRKDGRLLDVEIVMQDMPFEGRTACLVMANDVTEKERLRAEAEQVSRLAALGELSAGIAHEINNPNGMIQINLQLVADVWRDLEPVIRERLEADPEWSLGGLASKRLLGDMPELLDEMLKGTQRIRDIVEDLKDFARQDTQALDDEVDPNRVVMTAERMVKNQIRKAGADYHADLGGNLPPVRGNFRQLEQVLINLLMNACQALTGSGQRLAVTTRFDGEGDEVVIEVADGGRGIASQHLQRLTEPFFTTRREEGGTGLGLSVSSRIVQDHGGRLSFESAAGQGTLVSLRLPVLQKEVS